MKQNEKKVHTALTDKDLNIRELATKLAEHVDAKGRPVEKNQSGKYPKGSTTLFEYARKNKIKFSVSYDNDQISHAQSRVNDQELLVQQMKGGSAFLDNVQDEIKAQAKMLKAFKDRLQKMQNPKPLTPLQVLLDEPTIGLDPLKLGISIKEILDNTTATSNTTLLIEEYLRKNPDKIVSVMYELIAYEKNHPKKYNMMSNLYARCANILEGEELIPSTNSVISKMLAYCSQKPIVMKEVIRQIQNSQPEGEQFKESDFIIAFLLQGFDQVMEHSNALLPIIEQTKEFSPGTVKSFIMDIAGFFIKIFHMEDKVARHFLEGMATTIERSQKKQSGQEDVQYTMEDFVTVMQNALESIKSNVPKEILSGIEKSVEQEKAGRLQTEREMGRG